jgi:hypothetical protein
MKNAQSKFAQILGTVYQSRHRILLTGERCESKRRVMVVVYGLIGSEVFCIHVLSSYYDNWLTPSLFYPQAPLCRTTCPSCGLC